MISVKREYSDGVPCANFAVNLFILFSAAPNLVIHHHLLSRTLGWKDFQFKEFRFPSLFLSVLPFRSSFDVVLLKIGGRFKFFYTQNRLGCVFICRNVIRMSIFLQIDTIIQKLQRYLHKVRHRNTPFSLEPKIFART